MSESLLAIMQNDPSLRLEVDVVGESTYYGFTKNQDASKAQPVWMIARVTISGTAKQVLWTTSEKFDQIWNNRLTLFATAPFTNLKSIIFNRTDTNDFLLLANHSSLSFTHLEALTISAWARVTGGGAQVIFAKQGTGNNPGYRICFTAGRLEWHMAGTGGAGDRQEVRSALNTYNDENWHHLVVVKPANVDANNVTMFIDGVQIAPTITTNTLTTSPANAIAAEIAGRNASTTETLSGLIDEVAIWRVAMTPAEALAIFTLGAGGVPGNLGAHSQSANMVGWWRMGEGDTFPTITNLGTAGSATNGTMTNMKASDILGETAHVP